MTSLIKSSAAHIKFTTHSAQVFWRGVYENALKFELDRRGIEARQQAKLPVLYEGCPVGVFYPDLWIDKQLIIEVKAVQSLLPEHEIKLVHYLAATGINNGLLINFASSVQVKRKFRDYKPTISSAAAR